MQQSISTPPSRKHEENDTPSDSKQGASTASPPQPAPRTIELPAEPDADIEVPSDADPEEVAALVAAVSAHLQRERREAAAAASTQPEPTVDAWTMSGRYRTARTRATRTPSRLGSLGGWKLASRAHTFH
jgi:hypothetical protein